MATSRGKSGQTPSRDHLRAEAEGGPSDGSDYYVNWVNALEQILKHKNLADALSLASLKAQWEEAYKLTPHETCFYT